MINRKPVPWSARNTLERLKINRKVGMRPIEMRSYAVPFRKLEKRIEKVFEEIGVTPQSTKSKPVLIMAGFNAKLAKALKRSGLRVTFTDANPEWVERAKKQGFEAKEMDMFSIPEAELRKHSVLAIFEPDMKSLESNPDKERALRKLLDFLLQAKKTEKGLMIFFADKPDSIKSASESEIAKILGLKLTTKEIGEGLWYTHFRNI